MFIELTSSERDNLMVFLTGKGRIQLTGDEAFEFTRIVSKIASAKEENSIAYTGVKGQEGLPGLPGIDTPITEE